MADFIALCAAVLAALMVGFSDMSTDWTPQFLTVLAIIAVVIIAALTIGMVERIVRGPRTRPADAEEADSR